MQTPARVFFALSTLLLLAIGSEASAQAYRYAVEAGGLSTGTCPVTAPCTFDRALGQATAAGDVVAVRVRRTGGRAVLGNVTFQGRYVRLALYSEVDNPTVPHLVSGSLEIRGTVDLMAANAAVGYDGTMGKLIITGSRVDVRSGGISGTATFSAWATNNTFRGNIEFAGTTTLAHAGNSPTCAVFQHLTVASTGKLTVQGSCSNSVPSSLDGATGGSSATGVTVWNVLDVKGQLVLEDGLNLNLVAPRPTTKTDSAFSAPYKLPMGNVSGSASISGTGTLYLAVQQEVMTGDDYVAWAADSFSFFITSYTGWPNAQWLTVDEDRSITTDFLLPLPGDRFEIAGTGHIYMDVEKTTQGGVSIAPSFGTGATSTNRAGVLIVKSSAVRGHFNNLGRAQTEFVSTVKIDRDVIVESPPMSSFPRGGIGSGGSSQWTYGDEIECYAKPGRKKTGATQYVENNTLVTTRGLTTGVYFKGARTTIGGALEVRNGFRTPGANSVKTPAGCYGGAFIMKPTTVAYDVIGLDVGGADHAHFMIEGNLTVHGNFDMEEVTNVVTRREPASPVRVAGRTAGDVCAGKPPSRSGAHLVFAGSQEEQKVTLPHDLELAGVGLTVDKRTLEEVEINGGTVTTKSVDIQGGILNTNGLLDIRDGHLLINQKQGAIGDIRRGTGEKAYVVSQDDKGNDVVHVPTSISYTGSVASMDTGDELYDGMALESLELYLSAPTTQLTLLSKISVTNDMALNKGTLHLPSGIRLSAPQMDPGKKAGLLIVGEGFVEEDGGKWTTTQTGTIRFVGEMPRTTDNILPAYRSKSEKLGRVVVDGCAGDTKNPLKLTLRRGNSVFGEGLYINNRSIVDLAGNNIVMWQQNSSQTHPHYYSDIHIGSKAYLCNSDVRAAVQCSASAAHRKDDIGTLADALEAMHYDGSPKNRAAFDVARKAFDGSTSSSSAGGGSIYAVNGSSIDIFIHSNKDRLRWHLPSLVAEAYARIGILGGATQSTTTAPVPPNNSDELILEGLSLHGLAPAFWGWGGFDKYVIKGDVVVDSAASIWVDQYFDRNFNAIVNNHPEQLVMIGGNLTSIGGDIDLSTAALYVQGRYTQQEEDWYRTQTHVKAHYQHGGFHVGPNTGVGNHYFLNSAWTSVNDPPAGNHGATCPGEYRTVRGYQVPTGLRVYGDFAFLGSGDAYDGNKLVESELGLRGTVTFAGNGVQHVQTGAGGQSSFCNVVIHSDPTGAVGRIVQAGNVAQNRLGTLTLKRGTVSSGSHRWMLHNEAIEDSLVGTIAVDEDDEGVVRMGSRDAFFDGTVIRAVSRGNQGGGLVSGGYLFPTGTTNVNDMHSYRPMILQFPADLGTMQTASVNAATDIVADSMDWPEANLVVDGPNGTTLMLDNVADMFWKVQLDAAPAHDPNIRVAADGLPNIFDIKGLRLVQWDCDGTNPRLAGVYDMDNDGTDDESMLLNDFLNGIPNLTQEGIAVGTCSVLGIASNFLQNPISADPITSGTARVQFINNVAGATVDVYMDDHRIVDDFMFQSALPFATIAAGSHKLEIVPAQATDNGQPLLTQMMEFRPDRNYHVLAIGDAAAGLVHFTVQEDVRTESASANMVDFYFVHGASSVGEVDIRIIDAVDNSRVLALLANNFNFGDVGNYKTMDAGDYNLEVTTPNNDVQIDVFRMELHHYVNQALVLNLSGAGTSSGDGLTIIAVAEDGSVLFPQVVTASADAELPAAFALLGNYPNPFNPTTRIEFDLPETAFVRVALFDLQGRSVMTLPVRKVEAGAGRSIELDASALASGSYFYRVVATGNSGQWIGTGQMVVIK